MRNSLLGLVACGVILTPVLAQTMPGATGRSAQEEFQRGYAATPMPGQANINAGGQAGVQALNGQASAAAQANAGVSAADQAQYDADRAAYMDALAAHDHAVNRADARYIRQQRAYADAMAVWRVQVAACKRGHQRACDMPPPNPAAFY